MSTKAIVRPEDIDPHPVEYLLTYGSVDARAQYFADRFLRPTQHQRHSGAIEIVRPGFQPHHLWCALLGVKPPTEKPKVPDPFPLLNHWLYQRMKTGDAKVPIPSEIVLGFSNCGDFYGTFTWSFQKGNLLSPDITYPPHLVVQTAHGSYWTRSPETPKESLYNFIYSLRMLAEYLAAEPIGKKSIPSTSDVAHMLTSLKRRTALIRAGEATGRIQTYDTPPALSGPALAERWATIQAQTREKYCRPKAEIEQEQQGGSSPSQPQPKPRWRVNE